MISAVNGFFGLGANLFSLRYLMAGGNSLDRKTTLAGYAPSSWSPVLPKRRWRRFRSAMAFSNFAGVKSGQ